MHHRITAHLSTLPTCSRDTKLHFTTSLYIKLEIGKAHPLPPDCVTGDRYDIRDALMMKADLEPVIQSF